MLYENAMGSRALIIVIAVVAGFVIGIISVNPVVEAASGWKAAFDDLLAQITSNDSDIEDHETRISNLEADSQTYVVSDFVITNCSVPGCSQSFSVNCDANDIAIAGDPNGVYETTSGQTYTVSNNGPTTTNTSNDSWFWLFDYSGAPAGEREGVRFHATCLKTTP